jgi:hypothetical protein
MKCKVKVYHHSYHARKDLQPGEVVDLPKSVVEANDYFYEEVAEKYEAPPAPRVDRAKLEKDAIKAKVIKPDEVANLSLDQLTRLMDGRTEES